MQLRRFAPILSLLPLLALLAAGCARREPPRNVLLVVIDTLRADHLSCYGYERETSPNLDALAGEGLRFERTQSPRAKTTPAVASILTGLYPHDHGVRDLTLPLEPRATTLGEVLSKNGYRTAAVVGNYVLKRALTGFDRGFDTWIEELPDSKGVPPHDVPERCADSLTDAALELLGLGGSPGLIQGEKPWLLYLHYMDPHGLYDPPPEHRVFRAQRARPIEDGPSAVGDPPLRVATYNVTGDAWMVDGAIDAARVIDRYDGEIHYVDAELGRLFAALRAAGELERTWVVVVADHGESLGEHRYWFEHGLYAYQATCHVPLIVHPPLDLPDRPKPGVRRSQVSLADLAPTLFDWLDLRRVDRPHGRGPTGVSRASLLKGEDQRPHPVFSEKVDRAERSRAVQTKAVRRGRYKLLQRFVPDPRLEQLGVHEELYDLVTDPREEQNLIGTQLAPYVPLEDLRADLASFLEADEDFTELARILQEEREALSRRDPEILRRLEALGY